MAASITKQMPLLKTTNAEVPYKNQFPPAALTFPASMAILKPAPIKINPTGA